MLEALRTVRRLTDEGMKREIAEALVEEINAGMKDNLVTKSDLKTELALLRADIKADLSELKSELVGTRSDLRAEIREGKSDSRSYIDGVLSDFKTAITVRVAFLMVAQLFAMAGIGMYLKHGG
jgi:hypothetical protein